MKRALLILLLLLAACGPKEQDYPITDKDFQKGTAGLEIELYNSPPDRVFEESPFQVAGEVWNRGAYASSEAYITVTMETDYMCIVEGDKCVEQTLAYNPVFSPKLTPSTGAFTGKSLSSPQGTTADFSFSMMAKKLDVLSVEHTAPLIFTTCYAYTTELSQDICIDPDPTTEDVCETKTITLAGQGAPIVITKIEPRIIQKSDIIVPQFLVYIENKGNGEVVNYDALQAACSSQKLDYQQLNRVHLTSFWFSNKEYFYKNGDSSSNIRCTPNPIRLSGDNDYFMCELEQGLSKEQYMSAFTTQAHVRLDYGYMNSVSKKVLVESTS